MLATRGLLGLKATTGCKVPKESRVSRAKGAHRDCRDSGASTDSRDRSVPKAFRDPRVGLDTAVRRADTVRRVTKGVSVCRERLARRVRRVRQGRRAQSRDSRVMTGTRDRKASGARRDRKVSRARSVCRGQSVRRERLAHRVRMAFRVLTGCKASRVFADVLVSRATEASKAPTDSRVRRGTLEFRARRVIWATKETTGQSGYRDCRANKAPCGTTG